MERIAVLIPAYQPDEKMSALIQTLRAENLPVLLVDDGSGPAYGSLFHAAAALGAMVISYEENHGKGYALKAGIAAAQAEGFAGVVTADADGQHTVADILRVMQAMGQHPRALILGSRSTAEMPPRSRTGNRLTAFLFRALYSIELADTQTGLRGIPLEEGRAEALLHLEGDRYEYEMNMLIASPRLFGDIQEVPIKTIYIENNASSHFRPIADGMRIYRLLFAKFPRFALVSLLSFGIDYLLFTLFAYLFLFAAVPATVTARVISAVCNYTMNRHWVFTGAKKYYTLGRYALLALCILTMNCGLIWLLTNPLSLAPWCAKLITEGVLYCVSFSVQSRMAHKQEKAEPKPTVSSKG